MDNSDSDVEALPPVIPDDKYGWKPVPEQLGDKLLQLTEGELGPRTVICVDDLMDHVQSHAVSGDGRCGPRSAIMGEKLLSSTAGDPQVWREEPGDRELRRVYDDAGEIIVEHVFGHRDLTNSDLDRPILDEEDAMLIQLHVWGGVDSQEPGRTERREKDGA